MFEITQIEKPQAGLYIVATPIGNLGDITIRALQMLQVADFIFCEDTRITQRLLQAYNIQSKTLLVYNDNSDDSVRANISKKIADGNVVALVSDAGVPLISDPGYKLVRELVDNGIAMTAVPGASSALTSLILSALPTDNFTFNGFLPSKKEAAKEHLKGLKFTYGTMIFFERGSRIETSIKIISEIFGASQQIIIARELTKKFEEILRGRAETLLKEIKSRDGLKGEIVLLFNNPENSNTELDELHLQILEVLLLKYKVKDAAKMLCELTGISKNTAYEAALKIKND